MKEPQIIISILENTCGLVEGHQCHVFDTPAEAKQFILHNLEEESKELETPLKATSGTIMYMFNDSIREGNFGYAIGDHEYEIAFLKTKAEYKATEEEFFKTAEAFCNSSSSDYTKAAMLIVQKMHRYVQSEFWKLIKRCIRSFAVALSDERNASAVRQASQLTEFMDENNM